MDEQGLIWCYAFFFVVFSLMIITLGVALQRMYTEFHPVGDLNPFRPLLWIFLAALCAELLAYILYMMHYSVYADNGVGMPVAKILAEVCHGVSECILILLVVLIAKGWNVNDYSMGGKMTLGIGLMVLYMLYVAMIVEGNLHASMPTATYIYDTVPGIVVNCLRVLFAFVLLLVFAHGAVKAFAQANARAQQACET